MYCHNCGNKILPHHKFCVSCGKETDLGFLDEKKPPPIKPPKRTLDYKDLFHKMEATLKRESSLSEEEFKKHWGRFKKYHYKNDSDEEIYWKLVGVIFYSGMTAATVTSKLPSIKKYLYDYKIVKDYSEKQLEQMSSDDSIIRNKLKIKACRKNATIFDNIISNHGSFSNYIESFGDLDKESTLETLKNDLRQFDFLGPKTAYHLMLDLGLKVWKPDRVICRILERLGLIDDIEDNEKVVKVGREIAEQVGQPIRYVDIIFVKYGQVGNEEPFGLKDGICLEKNPRCSVCGIKEYCTFTGISS